MALLPILLAVSLPGTGLRNSIPQPLDSMAKMRDRSRPLLIFAAVDDPRRDRQIRLLTAHRKDLIDRQIVLVVTDHQAAREADRAIMILLPGENASLRDRFHVVDHEFTVLLLGKDGGEKFRSHTPVTIDQLNQLIDAMPMRQQEMKSRPSH